MRLSVQLFLTLTLLSSSKLIGQVESELIYPLSHSLAVNNFAFSSDSKYVVSSSLDGTAKLWDCDSRKLIRTFQGHGNHVNFVEFSPDNQFIVTASDDSTAIIWGLSSGKIIRKIKETSTVILAKFSHSGKILATSTADKTVNVWRVSDGVILHSIEDFNSEVYSIYFSKNDQWLSTKLARSICFWDTRSGLEVAKFDSQIPKANYQPGMPHREWGSDPFGSHDIVVITSRDSVVRLFDLNLKRVVKRLGKESSILASFSLNGDKLFVVYPKEIQILDVSRGQVNAELSDLYYPGRMANFVSSSQTVLYTGAEGNSTESGSFIQISETFGKISPNQQWLVTIDDANPKLLNIATLQQGFTKHKVTPLGVNINFDANTIRSSIVNAEGTLEAYAEGGIQQNVYIRNLKTREIIHELSGHHDLIGFMDFSSNGKWLITGELFNEVIRFWNIKTGSLEYTFDNGERSNGVIDIEFDKDYKFFTAKHRTKKVTHWDIERVKIDATKLILDDNNWLTIHPSGLFDASVEAMQQLYFVQGLDVIEFNQLKERFYEPGLWKKIIEKEKLRDVVDMKSIELPPDIQVGQVDAKGYLPIELTNKGGGIGEVTILINGKEAFADARPKKTRTDLPSLSLKVYIGNHKALIRGADNFVAAKAWNAGHWVVSRGVVVTYAMDGNENSYKPAIHIITSGVSDYTGTELDLKYAAKDAEDINQALQLGAKKLFGIEKSYSYNLTTSQQIDRYPTKANILKTFEKVTSVAHPLDVVVVYLSGHGINHGGQDGDWYYLTQDAYTSSSTAYNDPGIREKTTLSSRELVELFKKVPALKQVLMIDACASGKVVENLMDSKDIESSTLRALDRMRDRAGLHIITGCTADAMSYEASKYGQGVLTYSLLEGIRGAALRDDQFVDINKLFQYSQERVPPLAEGIGGIQTPQIFTPQGGQSFDIGQLTDQEKKDIPIAKIRPVYIRSNFIDDDQLEDALQLGKKVDEALNEAASKGSESSLIFVDVRDYPEGCKLSGRYKQQNGIIKLKFRKKCEGKDETLEIEGKTADEVKIKVLSVLK